MTVRSPRPRLVGKFGAGNPAKNDGRIRMADLADQYRKFAEEAREQAQRAISALDNERWLKIAEDWLELADSIDRRRLPSSGKG